VLTAIPEVANAKRRRGARRASAHVINHPASSFSESIRGLHLELLSEAERHKVVVVTSALPGEGKTVTAASLARFAANSGRRVIIVDADLRAPAVAHTMGLRRPAGGIVEALEGKLTLDRCIAADPSSDAFVLPCRRRANNPMELLSSEAMDRLIANLRNVYDLVIVDTAPMLPVHDTWSLPRFSDKVLFVARWGTTPRAAIGAALRSLKEMNAPVAGIALTRMSRQFRDTRHGHQNYFANTKYYSS
jgi:capsular exopolysaccharide synthesis family protein